MKSVLLTTVVVAVSALTSMNASAELLNQWLFDQMNVSSTQNRIKVKAEVSQPQQEAKAQAKSDSADLPKAGSTDAVKAGRVQVNQQ